MRKFILFFVLLLLAIPAVVFATGSGEELGLIGSILVESLKEIKIIGPLAITIYGAIVWAVVRGMTVVFNKIPTEYHEFGVSIGWQVVAFLFGSGVLTHNARTDGEPKSEEQLRKQLIKDNPVLQIDVRSL